MHARNLLVRFVLALLIWSDISSVFAAPPTPPSGFLAWWQFAQYFKNIVEGWLGVGTCPVWQSVIGFNTGASSLYGLPVCQAIASSQWTTNGTSIYYSAGNVAIGATAPSSPLHVTWIRWTTVNSANGIAKIWWWDVFINFWAFWWTPNYATWIQPLRISDNAVFDLLLNPVWWNIWIWTTSPVSKLDIGWNANNSVQATLTRAADSNFALQAINRSAVNAAGALVSSFWVYWWWLDSSSINFYRWGGAQDWKIALSTNATDRLFVENNGNVGIGTSTPSAKLEVAWDAKMGDIYGWVYGWTRAIWKFDNTNPSYGIFYTESSPDRLSFAPNWWWTATPSMSINGDNVGIGTTTPWQKLSVVGTIESTTGGFKFPDGTTQTTASLGGSWYDGWVTNPGYNANTIGASKSWFSYSNNAAHTWPLVHFDAGWYWLQLSADYSGGGEGMSFRTRNGDSGTWNGWHRIISTNTNWNVGIWTNSPSYKLQVQKSSVSAPAIMIWGWFAGWPRIQTYWLDADANAYMGLGTDMAWWPYESSIYYPLSWPGKLTFGTYNWTTYSEKMRLDGNWNLWIWTSSPWAKLDVNGAIKALWSSIFAQSNNSDTAYWAAPIQLREAMYWATSGYIPPRISLHWGWVVASQIGIESSGRIKIMNNPGTGYENFVANDITAASNMYANNYYYNSDKNLKKDIAKIDSALDKIRKLNWYYFTWKANNTPSIWVIAQEIEKEFPQIVWENKDANGIAHKTVQYGNLVAPLIESTKELADKSDAQEKEIQELKKQITELKEIISHK